MNIVFTYLKAHLANDAAAAVDVADYHPSFKNLSFARRILEIKSTTTKYNPYNKSKGSELNKTKVIEYSSLLKKLGEIEQRETYHDKDLRKANLKILNEYYYEGIKTSRNFSNSNLTGVDLSGALLEGSKFKSSDLSKTKININYADFSNAKLDGVEINFNLRCIDKNFMDKRLIDNLDGETIFHTLRSIDDKYSGIKIKLVKQLINKVMCSNNKYVNSDHIESFLNYIFSKEYYLKDKEIKNSVKSFLDRLIFTENSEKYINKNCLSSYLELISNFFNVQEKSDFMLESNEDFINLMAISLYHDDINIREKSRALYDKYLKLERVKSFYEENKIGNDERVNWDNEDNDNIIIINGSKTIVTSYKELNKMLLADITKANTQCASFSLYINKTRQDTNEINPNIIFNYDFKIFKDNYNIFLLNEKFNKLASKFGDYAEKFYSAFVGNPIQFEDRLVSNEEHSKLYKVFETLIDISRENAAIASLKEQHYQQICKIFGFENSNDRDKSKYLLSLAIIFVKYASNDVFGLGNKSPQVLKLYAYALMRKANELNEKLMGYTYYDFMPDLVGQGKETTDTSNIFIWMYEYGKIYCAPIFNEIMPPQWK